MAQRVYQPLNRERKEIRVLHLYGPWNQGFLRATLEHVSLDSKPKYEAISYCWAEVLGEDTLTLDGVILKVPASAVKVLRAFQPDGENESRAIWIDAICINQADIEERSHQVQMMGNIYRQCDSCLIWLGDHDESVDKAIASIEMILDDMIERTNKYENILEAWGAGAWDVDAKNDDSYSEALAAAGLDTKALTLLLQRPWFSRLWVQGIETLP